MGIVGLIAELLVVSLRISIHSIPKMGVRGVGEVQSETCRGVVALFAV